MIDEAKTDFTAEDLALVPDADDNGADDAVVEQKTDAPADDGKAKADVKAEVKDTDASPKGKTLADGADPDEEAAAKEAKADEKKAPKANPFKITDEMRDEIARHYAGSDKKKIDRELKRLERVGGDFKSMWGLYRELDNRLNGGGLVKVPGKDASEEEITAFQKAIGWTDKPEEMMEQIALTDGAVLGEDDKPVMAEFLGAIHGATSAPDLVSKAANWYFQRQEQIAAEIDEADFDFRDQSTKELKEDWGASFNRRKQAIPSIFATAPGGTDAKNEEGVFHRLINARTPDGKVVGNDPDILRWLDAIRNEINPTASVVEDGGGTQSVEAELEKIKDLRKTNPQKYWSNETQQREQELYGALEKVRARQTA